MDFEKMRESHVRREVMKLLNAKNYLTLPIENKNGKGFPDLLCFHDSPRRGKYYFFIELKQAAGDVHSLQERFYEKMIPFGIDTYIIYGKEGLLELLEKIENKKLEKK